jgi:serine/threonine protein kinase
MAKEHINEEEIFKKAIQFGNRDEQANYVKAACGDDKELRTAVEALLQYYYSRSILDSPILDAGLYHENTNVSEGPGFIIGHYKLLEKIGEGGMAVVYMAEQQEPIRRKVALKIIKLGMDTRQVTARFEAERQVLALLDHPNIAKVLDAGCTDTGRSYFVMDLVKGVSITEYCDHNNLSTKERLELFIQVCNAVQHAHTKGIIHRDIKPSNIMVTMHDGKAAVKVIDFGIAKAINQRLTEKTLFTRYAHIIGTPAYMSPEQAQMSDMDIDIRTDIYSLGVLLYELLTGTTPFSEDELRKAGYLEMQRVIIEKEPPKPSTKLTSLGNTLTEIAKHRGSTPNLLTKTIRGDLDWIVMKTLEKSRVSRYKAAEDLAVDIRQYLEHRPVTAHAHSMGYRLHKFLCRHRTPVIAVAAMVFVACAVAITVSILDAYWKSEIIRQTNIMSQVNSLIKYKNYKTARKMLRPLLKSKYIGFDARNLYAETLVDSNEPDEVVKDIMQKHYRELIKYYTEKIATNPEDANYYFLRAHKYSYLNEDEKVNADIDRYRAILNPHRGTEAYDNWLKSIGRDRKTPFGFFFGREMNLGPVINSIYEDDSPFISYDGLKLYFNSRRPGGFGDKDIWMTTRTTRDTIWGSPVNLGQIINTSGYEGCPRISADDLSLYFQSMRSGGYGTVDIWVARRAGPNEPWQEPVNLGGIINTEFEESRPSLTKDGLELYFDSKRSGGYGNWDIWVSRRATPNDPWQEPTNLGGIINTPNDEARSFISPDGLALFFNSGIAGSSLDQNMWMATRPTRSSDWNEPVPFQWLPGGTGVSVSGDGRTFVFASYHRNGIGFGPVVIAAASLDVWEVPAIPNLDFNGDENIDANDLKLLNDNQGTSDSSGKSIYDIGPMPWGDGLVDTKDLEVFMEYLK